MKIKLEGYESLEIDVSEKEVQSILSKSINKSITKAQKRSEKSITEQYFIGDTRVKKSIKAVRSKGTGSEAEIVVRSKVLGLESFKIRQTKTGVQAAVSKKKGWTMYEGAFIRNVRAFAGKDKKTGKTLYHENEFKIRVFKRKSNDKIGVLHGASIPGMAENDGIQKDIEKEFYDDLYQNINAELKKMY